MILVCERTKSNAIESFIWKCTLSFIRRVSFFLPGAYTIPATNLIVVFDFVSLFISFTLLVSLATGAHAFGWPDSI